MTLVREPCLDENALGQYINFDRLLIDQTVQSHIL